MALIMADSFNSYSGAGDLAQGKWIVSGTPVFSSGGGKFASNAVGPTNGSGISYWLETAQTDLRIGFYFRRSGATITKLVINSQLNSSASGYFGFDATGAFCLFNGVSSTPVVTGPPGRIVNGNQYWCELRILPTGITLYVDGLPTLSYTGAVTMGRYVGTFMSIGSTNDFLISQMVVWNASGGVFDEFPIGPQRLQFLRPNAVGDLAQWTPATGANWQAVDATGWGGGVGVTTSTNGAQDLHNMQDLSWTPWRINAIEIGVRAVDINAGGSSVKMITKNNAVVQAGPAVALPITNPVTKYSPFERNALGTRWTKADIDAMQVGYEAVL